MVTNTFLCPPETEWMAKIRGINKNTVCDNVNPTYWILGYQTDESI